MALLRSASGALNHFWFGPIPIEPVVLCRIAVGLIMLHAWGTYGWDLETLWLPDGMTYYASGRELELVHRATWTIYAVLMCCAASLTVGFATPVAALGLAVCHWLFLEPSRYFTWGWALQAPVMVVWLAVSGCGRAYSIDALIRRRLQPGWRPPSTIEAWPVRLIQIQVTAIYLRAAWGRLYSSGWWSGQEMFHALGDPDFARFNGIDWLRYRPVLVFGNFAGQLIEMSAPILLWVRKARPWMLLALVALHVGLEIPAGVHWWQVLMLAALLTFVPAHHARRVLQRLEGLASWASERGVGASSDPSRISLPED